MEAVTEERPAPVEERALAIVEASHAMLPVPMEVLREVAKIVVGSAQVHPKIQGNEELALAVAYQAARWGMDPVAVGSQAYPVEVRGEQGKYRLAYQAQLVSALIHRSPMLTGRLSYEFHGAGAQRYVIVRGKVRGVKKPLEYVSPTVGQIKPKNSPLWFTDPDQQLSYYGARAWARRHMSEAMMGVYAADEIETTATIVRSPEDRLSDLIEPEPEAVEPADAEFEDAEVPPPSGGGGPPVEPDTPASGGGQSVDPPLSDEEQKQLQAEVDYILGLKDAADVEKAWAAVAQTKPFLRLVAYNQDRANSIKRAVAKLRKDLADGS